MRFQGEMKWKPIQKVELSILGLTSTHLLPKPLCERLFNQAWAYRAMDDATMQQDV